MGKTMISIQIDEIEKRELETKAILKGLKLSELFRRGARMYGSFDEYFFNRLQDMSKTWNMPEYFILQSLCISWMSQGKAQTKADIPQYTAVEGIMPEFAFTEKGPLPSEDLELRLTKMKIENLETDSLELLEWKEKAGGLTANDRRFLESLRKKYNQTTEKA